LARVPYSGWLRLGSAPPLPAPPRSGLTRRGPSTAYPDRKPASFGATFETPFYQHHQRPQRTLGSLSSRARFLQKSGYGGRAPGARNPASSRDFSFLMEMNATALSPRARLSVPSLLLLTVSSRKLPPSRFPGSRLWMSSGCVPALQARGDPGPWAPLRPASRLARHMKYS
jgi:hypothetical protein